LDNNPLTHTMDHKGKASPVNTMNTNWRQTKINHLTAIRPPTDPRQGNIGLTKLLSPEMHKQLD
jgi:hypothetical protein